ncbi:hypothetical protein P692DRAFT_20849245 [Suillus brevipes Sb2]|nr:hypothetical protein P692DRAFT_20849245 [Suillus brevipes Sb2]
MVSSEAIHTVTERVACGDFQTSHSEEERKVLALMKQVKVITSHVPGSAASCLAMRNEIRVPDFWQQSILVTKNPMIVAQFFNMFIKAFLSSALGYDLKDVLRQGVLGVTKGYYGCVEAQDRGTLHCHMVIWLEGGLKYGNVAFHDRLLAFLDDSISNSVPPDPGAAVTHPLFECHPYAIRGVPNGIPKVQRNKARQKDLHNLLKECCFDLNKSYFCSTSAFDSSTEELELCCPDGMFIGLGASAKAVWYYITDYITKSQLKSHVAFAALGLAVSKLGEYNPQDDDLMFCAKHLLQKCAYAMILHQKLLAQQVSSYLLDFEDYFTSHQFAQLFWMMFEREIERDDPSPEYVENENVEGDNVVEDNLGDEIGVSVTKLGNLLEQCSQLTDYQLRNDRLQSLCLWDFVACVEKMILKMKAKRKTKLKIMRMIMELQWKRKSTL